jgi:hypothetical protein
MDQDRIDERAPGVFEPDTLLPSQYFDRVRRSSAPSGERRLLIAVLEDAVHVYLTQCTARDAQRQGLFRDAEEWIESKDSSWFVSFENICAVLALDADYLRRGLRVRKARALGNTAVASQAMDEEQETRLAANGD